MKLDFLNKIEAIILDMDELLVNSHEVHKDVFEKVIREHGASLSDPKNPLTQKEKAGAFGMRVIDFFKFLKEKYRISATAEQLNERFNELLLPIFGRDVQEMEGATELIKFLHGKYKLALASSAKRAKIDIVLKKLGVSNLFDAIVSGEDEIKRGKPAPDTFLKAAERLGVNPKKCLVFEDAKNGAEAAKASGMYCVGVHNKYTFEDIGVKQDLSIADIEVDSLVEAKKLFYD